MASASGSLRQQSQSSTSRTPSFAAAPSVISNAAGLTTLTGSNILSFQNNHLTGNVTDGAPTGVLTVK